MTRSAADQARPAATRRRRRWHAAALAPLLLLIACAAAADGETRPAGHAPVSGPARFTDTAFIAADGARLPLRKWLPKGPVRAVILALHGFNDYSHAFAMPAKDWAARGIATYAYDQRGFGGAPERGHWAGEGQLAVDAIVASRILRQTYPGRPLYLLGESMGGAVAILAATGAMHGVIAGPSGMPVADADGVVLSAPAVWGRNAMDFLPKAALFLGARFFPHMFLTGRGLHILASDNIPMLRQLARDPLVLKGARIDTIFGLVDLMDDALAAAPRLRMPTLLMYGAHDEVVPRRPIADFVADLPPGTAKRRTLAFYPHGYHMLLRDLDSATVAGDVASWIFNGNRPLPSHADAAEAAKDWPPRGAPALAGAALPLAAAGK